jgi:hypothetical protein
MTINMETRGRRYYEINERLAKQAKEMMSFSEYKTGSSTAEYIRLADEVYDIAEKAIEKRPEEADRIWFLASRYAQKCAEWVNRDNAIGTMCPSVMICGAGNFPTRKKEKQVTAWERHNAEFEKLQKYIDKIEAIGRGSEVIKAGDPYVIEKLEAKLEDAKALQEKMKAVNKAIRMKNVEAGDEKLKELGFEYEWNRETDYQNSYIAIKNDEGVFEKSGGWLDISGNFRKKRDHYAIVSFGQEDGARASITINEKEYSKYKKGMHIVVYDTIKCKVIDYVIFDISAGYKTYR